MTSQGRKEDLHEQLIDKSKVTFSDSETHISDSFTPRKQDLQNHSVYKTYS